MNNEKTQESTTAKITEGFSAMDVSLLYDLIIKIIIAKITFKGIYKTIYIYSYFTFVFVLVSIKLYNKNIYFCNV